MRRTAPRRDVAEIARWHARAATMDRARTWGTPGHCGRVRALEKLEIVPYYVSRTTKITPTSEVRVSRRGRGYEPPPMYDHLHSGARKAKKRGFKIGDGFYILGDGF
jgi:hypothetical protein